MKKVIKPAHPGEYAMLVDVPDGVQLTDSTVAVGGVTFQVAGGNTLRGTNAIKPTAVLAHAAIPFCFYFAIDTGVVEATNGTIWVVI